MRPAPLALAGFGYGPVQEADQIGLCFHGLSGHHHPVTGARALGPCSGAVSGEVSQIAGVNFFKSLRGYTSGIFPAALDAP